jgi:CBS domain-containing protein
VGRAQALQEVPAPSGELQSHEAAVVRVGQAAHQAGLRGAVGQLDGAVVAQEQVLGHVPDRGCARTLVTADGEEQLVLLAGQPCGRGLLLAPAQEASQRGAEGQQLLVLVVVQPCGHATAGCDDALTTGTTTIGHGGWCTRWVATSPHTTSPMEPGLDPGSPVARIAIRDVVVVGSDESVYAALSRMVEEGVDHLPVVDGDRVIGICTRADLLQVRIRELDQERVERGWLPARLPSIGS